MADLAFSGWLNGEMERLGLTQEALGNKVGVSHVTVSKWQRGKHLPEPQTLRKLAAVEAKRGELAGTQAEYDLTPATGTRARRFLASEIERLESELASLEVSAAPAPIVTLTAEVLAARLLAFYSGGGVDRPDAELRPALRAAFPVIWALGKRLSKPPENMLI